MRTLLVLRHGKSKRGPEWPSDFARPLAARGVENARRMGRFLVKLGFRPTLIVSSPANRAISTARLAASQLADPPIWEEPAVYEADTEDLLGVVRNLPDDQSVVLLVGHNFGLEYLVDELAGRDDSVLKTCSLAILHCAQPSWHNWGSGVCELAGLCHPRELPEED